MSVAPFSRSSYLPGFPRWANLDHDLEHHASPFHRLIDEAINRLLPDHDQVQYRQPQYIHHQQDHEVCVEVELPGVKTENLSVDLKGDKLVISGKRYSNSPLQSAGDIHVEVENQHNGGNPTPKQPKDAQVEKQAEMEDPSLSIVYQLNIPIGTKYDVENISATMGDGILNLKLPKIVEQVNTPRKIEIGSA